MVPLNKAIRSFRPVSNLSNIPAYDRPSAVNLDDQRPALGPEFLGVDRIIGLKGLFVNNRSAEVASQRPNGQISAILSEYKPVGCHWVPYNRTRPFVKPQCGEITSLAAWVESFGLWVHKIITYRLRGEQTCKNVSTRGFWTRPSPKGGAFGRLGQRLSPLVFTRRLAVSNPTQCQWIQGGPKLPGQVSFRLYSKLIERAMPAIG
jgi:hypothetical protein